MIPRRQVQLTIFGRAELLYVTGIVQKAHFTSRGCLLQVSKEPTRTENSKQTRTLWDLWEPRWKKIQNQLNDTRSLLNRYSSQLSYHASKAKTSIQEANKKLAAQEREKSDQRLNYNKDVKTSEKIKDLPSQRELHRRKWSRKLEFYFDSLQETIFTATRALNDVTGYSSIQRLRNSIELLEKSTEENRIELKKLKDTYADAIEQRTRSQKELNELLQRKSSWSPTDLERFTEIYKDDALNLKREQELKLEVSAKESKQEELGDDLYRAILTRYHEEQIWSDKIRRTSTWGTFILMGVNIFLFLVFQLLLEPWKRRRLTRSFEDKVKKALEDYSVEQNLKLEAMSANIKRGSSRVEEPQRITTEKVPPQEPRIVLTAPEQSEHETIKNKQLIERVWAWIKNFGNKFQPSSISQWDSQTTFSNVELYTYSILLLFLGVVSTALIK